MLPGFGSGLWAEKERSAEICRAQKHCHLLTRPGTQHWTLPCHRSPFANARAQDTSCHPSWADVSWAGGRAGLRRDGPAKARQREGQAVGTDVQRIKSWPQRWRSSPDCSAAGTLTAHKPGDDGGHPAHPEIVNKPLPCSKKRLQSIGAASSTAASCRQGGRVLVITASDARAAKDLGKCLLGCKKTF